MREIKFRGKREDNGEWVYGYYIKENGVCGIMTESKARNFLIWNEVIPESVGQYTGLKELYGGDIVKYIDESRTPQVGWVVDLGWKVYIQAVGGDEEGNQDLELHPYNCDNVEIIGNTIENKELLK